MNQGGSVRCMVTHLARLRYFVVTFISSCILDQCSQERVPACRVVRSYVPQYLDRASTLLWFGFALFPLFFCHLSSVFCCFSSVFLYFVAWFLCFSSIISVYCHFSSVFPCFVAWFLCFSSIISVLMLGSSVFPLFSLSISYNSVKNLPILLTNRVTFPDFTSLHQPIEPT
jgi:hypothetical protein